VQSQLQVELDSAMIVFSDRFILPDFQPHNQPAEKVRNAEHCSAWKSENRFEPSDARRSTHAANYITAEKSSNVSRFQASNRCATCWNHICSLSFGIDHAQCAGANGVAIF
jgi:hypothetical protein